MLTASNYLRGLRTQECQNVCVCVEHICSSGSPTPHIPSLSLSLCLQLMARVPLEI